LKRADPDYLGYAIATSENAAQAAPRIASQSESALLAACFEAKHSSSPISRFLSEANVLYAKALSQ
jgi:hypothetical protein